MIKLFVIDVDGTLTDGGIIYDDAGTETKRFNTRDGAGFFALKQLGIRIMVLTGRECKATEKRMKELHTDYLFQNVRDKAEFLNNFCKNEGYRKVDLAYVGDDLNDISAMKLCSFIACPADACPEVKKISNYISSVNGGYGVLRDVVEYYLRKKNEWEKAVSNIYRI